MGFTLRMGTPAEFERARRVLETPQVAAVFDSEETVGEVPEAGLLASLGMLEAVPEGWKPAVSVAHLEGLVLAADLAKASPKPPDVVYPVTDQSREYLDLLPQSPCERFLDLGAGTGVAALLAASRYAGRAWACDVTPRAAHFAEFNRRLNGIENATTLCGDLFAPVEGLRFDRIGSHPPCVPVSEETHIFRDGGEDGEQVLRRIVEAVPDYLAPGGRFYALGMGSDREDETFEQRLRRWLGPRAGEFDILLVANAVRTPDKLKSPRGEEEKGHWERVFEKYKVKRLFFGAIMLERHAARRQPYAFRTLAGSRSTWREAEWLRELMSAAACGGAWLLEGAPRISPHVEVQITHRVKDGQLAADEAVIRVDYPFAVECHCRPWMVELVRACDGRRSGRDHFSACSGIAETGFVEILRALAAGGVIHYEAFPLPL